MAMMMTIGLTTTTLNLIGAMTTRRTIGTTSRRFFRVETIYDYDTPTERREVSYETARTARELLKRRGVHLGKDEKARGDHRYFSESGAWIIYRRCSREEAENN